MTDLSPGQEARDQSEISQGRKTRPFFKKKNSQYLIPKGCKLTGTSSTEQGKGKKAHLTQLRKRRKGRLPKQGTRGEKTMRGQGTTESSQATHCKDSLGGENGMGGGWGEWIDGILAQLRMRMQRDEVAFLSINPLVQPGQQHCLPGAAWSLGGPWGECGVR